MHKTEPAATSASTTTGISSNTPTEMTVQAPQADGLGPARSSSSSMVASTATNNSSPPLADDEHTPNAPASCCAASATGKVVAINDRNLVALNTEAVLRLQRGLYYESIQLFREGLHWLEVEGSNMLLRQSRGAMAVFPASTSSSTGSEVTVVRGNFNLDQQENIQRHFSLFDRAAVFLPVEDWEQHQEQTYPGRTTLSPARMAMIAAALLYNIGLAYHLIGLKSGDNQRAFLFEAINHYGAAAEMLTTIKLSIISLHKCSSQQPTNHQLVDKTKLLTLSVLNNQGHIFSLFHDIGRAHDSLMMLAARLREDDCRYDVSEVMMHFHLSVAIYSKGMGAFNAASAA